MSGTYVYVHRVTFDETNVVGNVYFVHFLRWQGHCRELFLADHAPSLLRELSDGLALVTTGCDIEFFAEAHAFDDIEVHMALDRLAGHRIAMVFDYFRTGAEPRLLARGRQSVAVMRRVGTTLEPTEVPEELAQALRRYASGDPQQQGDRGRKP